MVKNLPTNVGDMGLIPGLGRFHMPADQQSLCTITTLLTLKNIQLD